MRYAARKDENHNAIVERLQKHGWSAWDMSGVGKGWFDVVAVKHGRVLWIEIKNPDKRHAKKYRVPNPKQADLHDKFRQAGAEVVVLTSVEGVGEL